MAEMTCVFHFDVRKFCGNPHQADTPFGRPVIVSMGNLAADLDAKDAEIARLTAERDEAVNALRRAYQNATKREDTPCATI